MASAPIVVFDFFDSNMFLEGFEEFVKKFNDYCKVLNIYQNFTNKIKEWRQSPPHIFFRGEIMNKRFFISKLKHIAKDNELILYLISHCHFLEKNSQLTYKDFPVSYTPTKYAIKSMIDSGSSYACLNHFNI